MSLISYALKGNFKRFYDKLDDISKETGKNKISLIGNFLYCFVKIGSGYSDYLNYELYKRSKKEILEYVTIKDQDKFYEIVSPSAYKTEFSVKPNFLKKYKKYIGRDYFYNESFDKFKKFIKANDTFMVKPVDGLGGHGVKKMESKDIKNLEEFYDEVKKDNLLLEGYVIQNKKVSAICKESVNTIRIMTFSYNGKSRILGAFMRIGNGNSHVDNFHGGGMGVSINIEEGKLYGEAIDKDLRHFEVHPKSGKKFDGFKIPNWDIITKTVLDAALMSKHIHVVGWDVAVTEEGCVLIEGNRRPGFDLPQVMADHGRRDMMRDVLNEINAIEGTNYKI